LKITIGLVSLFLYAVVSNMYQYGYGINDAFWRVVWSIDEGTIWAKGFTEENFNKVRVGMPKKQVLSLLGKPLNDISQPDNSRFWYYTHHDSGTSDFDQRWVVFNSDNRVEEVRKSFYID